MNHVELTDSQRQILTTLVNKHQQTDAPVKADEIAAVIDRKPGSVRNKMQSLKGLNFAEGVPGPKGGYKPTESAYAVLDRDDLDERATVTLSKDYDRIDVTVDGITFPNVFHAEECIARIHFQQAVPEISVGDPIVVGPTPLSQLAIAGEVELVNDTADEVRVDVAVMEAPLTEE